MTNKNILNFSNISNSKILLIIALSKNHTKNNSKNNNINRMISVIIVHINYKGLIMINLIKNTSNNVK